MEPHGSPEFTAAADWYRQLCGCIGAATWGQVDDTPFGGGAGMVLRVDVMEAALRARYGGDPAAPDRRVIALTSVSIVEYGAFETDDLEEPQCERSTRLLWQANAAVNAERIYAPEPRPLRA